MPILIVPAMRLPMQVPARASSTDHGDVKHLHELERIAGRFELVRVVEIKKDVALPAIADGGVDEIAVRHGPAGGPGADAGGPALEVLGAVARAVELGRAVQPAID